METMTWLLVFIVSCFAITVGAYWLLLILFWFSDLKDKKGESKDDELVRK